MKVAYNACFGGFSLSPLALTAFAKKKGITLYWYTKVDDRKILAWGEGKLRRLHRPPKAGGWSTFPLTEDIGEVANNYLETSYYSEPFYEEDRSDPDLIEVIETLGSLANGMCSNLQIKEIPDGASYEITEYDGYEDVEPPRPDW